MTQPTARFMAASCFHAPFSPHEPLEWLLGRVGDLKPTHFIILGDLMDAGAASVHPDEGIEELEYEYEKAHDILKAIRKEVPKDCKLVWCLGNHDDNIQVRDPRRIPDKIRSLLHWNKHWEFGPEFRCWRQLPYVKDSRCVYRLGPVRFMHGFQAGSNADEMETLQMVNVLQDQAWGLWVRGHTHRPTQGIVQCKRTQTILLPWFYANAGTMGPLKPDYMRRKDSSRWGHAFVHGECSLSSPRRPSPKDWSAEVEHYG